MSLSLVRRLACSRMRPSQINRRQQRHAVRADWTSAELLEDRVLLASPVNLQSDIEWDENPGQAGDQQTYSNVGAIEAAFNNARRQEERQLGLRANQLGTLQLPVNYANLPDQEKALLISNAERVARAGTGQGVIGLPFEGIEPNIQSLATQYAQYLVSTNQWTHNPSGGTFGGTSPFSRIDNHQAIGDRAGANGCHEFLPRAENLAIFASTAPIPLPVERALYNFIYVDAGSNWGHREAMLLQDEALNRQPGFQNNTGDPNSEGYMGLAVLGRSDGSYNILGSRFRYQTAVVFEMFDPVPDSACPYNSSRAPSSVSLSASTNEGKEADQTAITITATANMPVNGEQTVTINVSGPNITATDYTLSQSQFAFANGGDTASVTLTIADDADVETTENLTVSLSAPTAGVTLGTPNSLTISIEDNDDPAGVTVTQTGGRTVVGENGNTDSFTVVLDGRPATPVELQVQSDNPQEANVDRTTLRFTPDTWSTPQTVTVTAGDDGAADGNQNVTITVAVNRTASDTSYANVADQTVRVTTIDTTERRMLDIDGDNSSNPLSDGVMVLRYLAGLTGSAVTNGTVNPLGSRDAAGISRWLDDAREVFLDVDHDDHWEPLRDGVLVIRYLAGFTGQALTKGVVNPDGRRTSPADIAGLLSRFRATSTAPAATVNTVRGVVASADSVAEPPAPSHVAATIPPTWHPSRNDLDRLFEESAFIGF